MMSEKLATLAILKKWYLDIKVMTPYFLKKPGKFFGAIARFVEVTGEN